MDVAAAFDLEFSDDLDGGVVEHLQIVLIEGHDWGDDDGVTGVDANWVNVFHAADGDRVVFAVAHDLEFDFLISFDGFLDEDLVDRGEGEAVSCNFDELFIVIGESATSSTKGESWSKNDWVADIVSGLQSLVDIVGDFGWDNWLTDLLAHLFEEFSVLSLLDGFGWGAKKQGAALFEDAFSLKLHSKVETGLSADAWDDCVWSFVTKDLRDVIKGKRLHVDLVRNLGVGHDGRWVGVDEDDLVSFLFES